MSATAVPPPQHYGKAYPRYHESSSSSSHIPINGSAKLAYHGYNPSDPAAAPAPSPNNTNINNNGDSAKPRLSTSSNHALKTTPVMSDSSRKERKPDWNKFYEKGLPKEVIVIDDSPPHDSASRRALPDHVKHQDKRRRVDNAYDPVHSASHANGSSAAYTAGAAPTNGNSAPSSSSNHRVQKLDESKSGQKRKRPSDHDEAEIEQVTAQNYAWSNYVPPPRPPLKAKEVKVELVRDVSPLFHADVSIAADRSTEIFQCRCQGGRR